MTDNSIPQYDAVRALDAVVARLRDRHPDLIDLTRAGLSGCFTRSVILKTACRR
jgi:hypothetical protein